MWCVVHVRNGGEATEHGKIIFTTGHVGTGKQGSKGSNSIGMDYNRTENEGIWMPDSRVLWYQLCCLPKFSDSLEMPFRKHYPNSCRQFANESTLPLRTKLTEEEVEYVIDNYWRIVRGYVWCFFYGRWASPINTAFTQKANLYLWIFSCGTLFSTSQSFTFCLSSCSLRSFIITHTSSSINPKLVSYNSSQHPFHKFPAWGYHTRLTEWSSVFHCFSPLNLV